jgi:ubiquinone/menaquinone biosynthesis C-methylase UbiE
MEEKKINEKVLNKQLSAEQLGDRAYYENINLVPLYEKKRRKIINNWLKDICKGDKKVIVDIGCGYGVLTKNFTDKADVYGVDINDKYLEIAKENKLIPVKADISGKLPFKDEFADVIVAGEVIEHTLEPEKVLKEFNRVLKKDGKLIITVPNVSSVASLFFLIFYNRPLPEVFTPFHFSYFCLKNLSELIKKNGFIICKKSTNEVLPTYIFSRYIPRYIPFMGTILSKTFHLLNILLLDRLFVRFGFQIILLLKKDKKES